MDPFTSFVMATLMALLNGAILGVVHSDLPEALRPSALDWRRSTLLLAAGSTLLTAQGHAPNVVLPIANGVLMLGITGYWRSIRRFYGKPDSPWVALPFALAMPPTAFFASVMPSLRLRIVVASVGWVSILGATFVTLIRERVKERAVSRKVLAVLFGSVLAFMAMRGTYYGIMGASTATVLDKSALNVATPIFAAMLPVIGTTAFTLMCSEKIRRNWEIAASTDYLTGLANRLTLGAEATRRWEESADLAVAVVDIDHFKSINDRYGHDTGDLALKHVARCLAGACRRDDLPARQGGEEFVVVFRGLDASKAEEAGERLRTAVAKEPFVTGDVHLDLTVSVGIAARTPRDGSFEDVVRRADTALYRAKDRGRNRVEIG
ncbi:MAG: GGDEF domain-containing protein [Myxococcales bacterium]|nr:GGDEF domain-containing protein [Myxococcales bacterium]